MSKIKNMKLRYKIGVGVATAGAIAGMAGGAFAYFTGSGTGTGQASVGSTDTWTVGQNGSALGAMYPGNGQSVVTFTVTNGATSYQGIDSASQVTPTVNAVTTGANAGDITSSNGTPVPGCLASWFSVSLGAPTPGYGSSVAPSTGTYSFPVTVTMSNALDTTNNNAPVNQDACKGAFPDINLKVVNSKGV